MKRWVTNLGLLQIFCALLLVIIIMFVSNFIVYRNSISNIYERMSENNTLAVKSVIQSFDSSFQSINNIIHTIHSLPYNNLHASDGELDMNRVYTMQAQVESIVSANDVIEDVIVFYDGVPLAITTKGTSNMEHLFGRKYKHEMYDASYWQKFVRSRHDHTIFPAERYGVLSDTSYTYKSKELLVVVGGNKVSMSNKHIIVLVDAAALRARVNQAMVIPGSSLIVLDSSRNILIGTDAEWDLMGILNDVYFNASREASLTRENYEYHFYQSEYNGFIYIDRVPYQFQNLGTVTQANHSIMLTAIVSALLLSVLMSIYLNRPVRNILRLLGGGHSKGNDFRKIQSGIVKLQAENEQYRRQLAFVDASLRRSVFLQMLDGSALSETAEQELSRIVPELFRERHFMLASLVVAAGTEEEPVPADALAMTLQEGLRSDGLRATVFHEAGSRFLVMLGVEQANGKARTLQLLRQSAKRLEHESLRGCRIDGCVSKLYGSVAAHGKPAYDDVRFGLVFRPVNANTAILDTEDWQVSWNLYYPYERIEKISNCLIGGKLPDAAAIIRETMRENAERRVSRHQLEHIGKAIFYVMLRLTESTDLDAKALVRLEREFHHRMAAAHDHIGMEEALTDAAGTIARHCKQEQKSKLNPVFISQYIDLHYMENLYLDHMAEVVNTSPKYFSNYFKKAFGVNFIEYLNKVRLTHARELLKESNLSIAEIGERIGYMNASTFTTTFKKYFGISPSDFRKQHQLGA